MRYILDRRYRLCGWERLPWAVVDRELSRAHFVDRRTMETLELCDAQIDLSLPLIPDWAREIAVRLARDGIVHESDVSDVLEETQRYRLYPSRFMECVHWSVTGRCNCRCRHCYMSAADAKYGELSHDDAMRIVRGMGECGVLKCSLTGGEALVRDDFWGIVDALTEQEIRITQIYSNGLLVRPAFLDGLERRGLRPEINMSFDGIGRHDWLRGITGAERAVRAAFELCQERGFPTGAETCLWRENVRSLRESMNYLASVGCRGVKLNPVSDTGAWTAGGYGADHSLSRDELYQAYLDYLDEFYADLPHISIHMGGFIMVDGRHPERYHLPGVHVYGNPMRASLCVHARNNMYISAEGRALTCMSLSSMDDFQRAYPKVQEVGLASCLSDSTYLELIDTRAEGVLAHSERCADCTWRTLCLGGCRASAMESHPGDVLAIDEAACEIYRGGWIERILDKVSKLRPDATCVELELLRKAGREEELALFGVA